MKKRLIIFIIFFITIILVIFYLNLLKSNNYNDVNTGSWKIIDNLIIDNYNIEFHYLNLKSKNLDKIPDICNMIKGTNYIDDIWSINLSNNKLTKINIDLSCLKNLQELNLSFNKIRKIENLKELTFIKKLDLGNNEISKIDNIDKLTTLTDLHLWYNKIISTNWLEKLVNLTSLKLQHNEISNLSWLKYLSKLTELKLEFNKLNDENLKDITNLSNLKILTLWENNWIKKETIDKFDEYSLKNMDILKNDETN